MTEPCAPSLSGQTAADLYFVDFDHTLLRSNSTQEFLRTTQPFVFIWPLLQLIGAVMRALGLSDRTRFIWQDSLKVGLLRTLNPWALARFRRYAPQIIERHLNQDVADQLADIPSDKIIIISFGAKPVIEALLADTRFADCDIIAPRFAESREFRRRGKISILQEIGIMPTKASILMTDNLEDDADLAATVGTVIEVQPDHDTIIYRQPYIPFYYTAKIKRTPGFLIKQVFMEELPVILLAYGLVALPALPIGTWIALSLLFLALMLTYELGYAENDHVGARKEKAPKLSENFFRHRDYKLSPDAWIWALGLSFAGMLVMGADAQTFALERMGVASTGNLWLNTGLLTAVWALVLIVLRLAFTAFNHAPLIWRVYIYAILHIVKYLGFALVFVASAAGLVFIYAHIVRTWSLYAVRRSGGSIEFMLSQTVRTVFLLFGFSILAMIDLSLVLTWQAGIILAFCLIRGAPEILRKT
ncbi:MAG: HAD family hydrolase [Pseudomonadota bacterium]